MKLTQRLTDLIEEQDNDEGDALIAIMLDAEATQVEIEAVLFDFMLTVPGFSEDNGEAWKIRRYIDANILADDEEDLSADETTADNDDNEDDNEDAPEFDEDEDDDES